MPAEAPAGTDLKELADRIHRLNQDNVELFRQLVEGEQRFRGLAKAVWRVQEEERRRLARELHDSLGQTLTALKIQLQRLSARAEDSDPQLARELAGTGDVVHEALAEARRLSHLLRPRVLDDLGLVPALRWLGRTLGEGTGFRVQLALDDLDDGRLPPELETLVFRVSQEAVTNALKHSGADACELRLERRGGGLRLTVTDDGRGFDPAAVARGDGGHGLAGIRDRVEIFGGKLQIRSQPGEGATMEIWLPLGSGAASSVDKPPKESQ
ncbi:MAG: sensor histidine kinase [Acidobacteriota bacterium]|nr:sensor histidine kinase [Acidobacteriota bacterium]